ncbi:MAG: hypothetical protein ACFFDH_04040 [Promethearchaeota archaeon]
MKKQIKSIISIILIGFMCFAIIPSFLIVPSAIQTTISFDTVDNQEPELKTSQFIPRTIRVAIYNEPNTTEPAYSSHSTLTNNYTAIQTLLLEAEYQVIELTCDDIYNHALMTADYDVFIMVDNLPRENITNYVKEFWLGGGGILSFDSAIPYLFYAGILVPESEGSEGWGISNYWVYGSSTTHNVSSRNPITKDYQVNDKFTSAGAGSCFLYWDELLASSVGSNIVKLANDDGNFNEATAVALDPSSNGGRVIHLPGRGDSIGTNMDNLIIDAVNWLCPRPKGRILFDMSHYNGFGVDSWDFSDGYVGYSTLFSLLRDYLVIRSYTFDKLYPSASGNLTTSNLAPYDMLIINLPDTNFTASEITNIMDWVNNGGGLLALGDEFSYDGSKHLNYLLASTDLSIINVGPHTTLTTSFEHPTEEGCTSLYMNNGDEVTHTGNAFPLWGSSTSEICIACEEYGNGRIILTGDMLLSDDRIGSDHNSRFGMNVANWLTTSQAKILYFTDYYPLPTDDRNPVQNALNELKLPFVLTQDDYYFNLLLYQYDWDLVIVNTPAYSFDHDILIDYIDSGGRLIMDDWTVNEDPSNPLWAKLGFSFAADLPDDNPIYIWNPSHNIFTTPAPYSASIFSQVDSYGDQGDLLTVYPNATALAGHTSTELADNALIVLRNDGRTIYNGFLIDQFRGDTDDSTYADHYELWINEIAYILYRSLSVDILDPQTDDSFGATAPSFSIATDGITIEEIYYTLNDTGHYTITSANGTINQGAWDALSDGIIPFKVYVEDTVGNIISDEVSIVKDTKESSIGINFFMTGILITLFSSMAITVVITKMYRKKQIN